MQKFFTPRAVPLSVWIAAFSMFVGCQGTVNVAGDVNINGKLEGVVQNAPGTAAPVPGTTAFVAQVQADGSLTPVTQPVPVDASGKISIDVNVNVSGTFVLVTQAPSGEKQMSVIPP